MTERWLVTGALGCIGAWTAVTLVREGARVAAFDLGEAHKVAILSVTEGEDKPAKYPKMFEKARYAVLSKMDLLPHVPFDVDRAVACARGVNPDLEFLFTSALQPEGMQEWYAFLRAQLRRRSAA